MATILDKDLVRESTLKYNDREILVTLTADQAISFKLKGMKSGIVNIGIEELYRQLVGDEDVLTGSGATMVLDKPEKVSKSKLEKISKEDPIIHLNDLRAKSLVTHMPLETKLLFEGLIVECIEDHVRRSVDKPKK